MKSKIDCKAISGKGFDVKAILSPTVPEGQELRFCLQLQFSEEIISSRFISNFSFNRLVLYSFQKKICKPCFYWFKK
jgi:8-amino-7-oxononanoate synthase